MKGITRGYLISLIGTMLIVGNVINCSGIDEDQELLSTGITYLSWSETGGGYLNESHSHFEFYMDFEISNPNNEEIIVSFPTLGNDFYANMTVTFKRNNYDSYDHLSFIGLSAVWERNFTPGITKDNTTFILSIKEQGLTNLPDGIYDIWIFSTSFVSFDYNHTELAINKGIPIIDYDPETTIRLGIQWFSMIGCISVSLIAMIILTKKRKTRIIRNH
ncbi:MAG: hypothetical protein JJE41_15090 [Candidatus Heimdallarchaeota archaeon]|nr:hypothetical protein [Candidatus Heimdallarchaeota archaeon]